MTNSETMKVGIELGPLARGLLAVLVGKPEQGTDYIAQCSGRSEAEVRAAAVELRAAGYATGRLGGSGDSDMVTVRLTETGYLMGCGREDLAEKFAGRR